jgi:hypothetical protein
MKKKSSKKPRKATKLKALSQTHGKEESNFKPTTLDQIWGDDGVAKYGTLDEGEYKSRVEGMHFSDLRTHAADIGLIPIDDRNLLTKRVLSEFQRHRNNYTAPADDVNGPEPEISEKARKILEEGK